MRDEDFKQVAAEIVLGEEAQRFMDSDLGRLVLGFARQEVERAVDDLLRADPQDTKTIREIQLRAAFGANFDKWLREIVAEGEQSLQAFKRETGE